CSWYSAGFVAAFRGVRRSDSLPTVWRHHFDGNRPGCVQVEIALWESDHDPVLRKRAGDHQAQVTGYLSGIGSGDVHPKAKLESERAVIEPGEEHLRLWGFLHQPMPLRHFAQCLNDAPRVRAVGHSDSHLETHVLVGIGP